MIISEDYYATNLDVWLLSIHYNIPLIVLSSTSLLESKKNYMVFNSTDSVEYYFLKVGAVMLEIPPVYTIITDDADRYKINIDTLRSSVIKGEFKKAPVGNIILSFIKSFSLKEANVRKKIVSKLSLKTATEAAETVAAKSAKTAATERRKPLNVKPKTNKASAAAPATAMPTANAAMPTANAATLAPEPALAPIGTVKKLKTKLKLVV
jgi:hypothetical protein